MAKGPFMEFLRAKVSQAVMNTYEEKQIPTPTSRTETMAMLIHSIELLPSSLSDTAPTNSDAIFTHLSKTSKVIAGGLEDPDILAVYSVLTRLNAVIHGFHVTGSSKQVFDPPILYPHANLFAAVMTSGFGAIVDLEVRIGYTLEKVSREDFISALVE